MVSLLVMLCTLSSRLLGFMRIAVIGALFGASGTADVWNAVFTIPNNFRKLLAGIIDSRVQPVIRAPVIFGSAVIMIAARMGSLNALEQDNGNGFWRRWLGLLPGFHFLYSF